MMVSVCIATYNGGKYIKAQLESILKQIGSDDEVVISDDNSNDDTLEIISRLNDERIIVVKNDYPRGYTRNFENALRHSSGDIIFLSDQDDVWLEGKLSIMSKSLDKYDFVVSDAAVVNGNLETIALSHFEQNRVRKGFLMNLVQTRYIGACMAFRREVLEVALPFPSNRKLCAHDYWLTLIAESMFKVHLEPTQLIMYRRHEANASTGGMKSKNTIMHKLIVRIYCVFQLVLVKNRCRFLNKKMNADKKGK